MDANHVQRTGVSGRLLAVMVGSLVLTPACGRLPAATHDPLADSTWEMTAVWQDGDLAGANPTSIVVAGFADGAVSGYDGCNDYRFTYSIDDESVSFSDLSVTGRACEPTDFEPQGDEFLAAIQASTQFEMSEQSLELTDDNGDVQLRFRPANELPLVGVAWRLEGYASGNGAMTSPLSGSRISLAFAADGTLGGIAGCNDYGADYILAGNLITVDGLVSTERACLEPDGIMTQDTDYLEVLTRVTGFATNLTLLVLLDADENVLAEYRFAGRVR